MKFTERHFGEILAELIDENPFAIRAVLRILEVRFTTAVPTLAVTCEARPRLLVNLDFMNAHCATEAHAKAVVCHEFLHVLLRHTEERRPYTPARHLAFDAVINAIIHRTHGEDYSSMMARYYAHVRDLRKLLRPMNPEERTRCLSRHGKRAALPQWVQAWNGLYDGQLVADDIEALAETLARGAGRGSGVFRLKAGLPGDNGAWLGDHETLGEALGGVLQEALDQALRQMNGTGIWRSPRSRGAGANPYEALFAAEHEAMRRWERRTLEILRRHLTPDRRSRAMRPVEGEYRLPVLSPRDRRAFLRARWAPFLPEATWAAQRPRRDGTAQVYLDVSGSMHAEMPRIVALLGRLSRHIRRPFWAFSDVVAPAVILGGQLRAQTTGGTSMSCVLAHVAETRPEAAVVVTDGYIEEVDPGLARRAAATRLHVLVTRDGNPAAIARAGLPYTQLERLPE